MEQTRHVVVEAHFEQKGMAMVHCELLRVVSKRHTDRIIKKRVVDGTILRIY